MSHCINLNIRDFIKWSNEGAICYINDFVFINEVSYIWCKKSKKSI